MVGAVFAAALMLLAVKVLAGEKLPERLTMTVGSERAFTVPGLQRIAIGDASVADVRTAGADEVKLSALDEGKTTLLIWTKDGDRVSCLVVVVPRPGVRPTPVKEATWGVAGVRDVTPKVSKTISVKVGANVRVAITGLTNVTVGDADVADIDADDKGLVVKGLAPGTTMLLLWKGHEKLAWRINVSR